MIKIRLEKPERDSSILFCEWRVDGSNWIVQDCKVIVDEVARSIKFNSMSEPKFDHVLLYKKLLGIGNHVFNTDGVNTFLIEIETVNNDFKILIKEETFPPKSLAFLNNAREETYLNKCLLEAKNKFGLSI